MREVGRKLKEHKGPGPALTPEEQQKFSALAQRQKEETARAIAVKNQAIELTLDTLAISLAMSEKCHFSGRFGDVAEIIKKHPIVLEHAQGFWELKWNYDKNLPNMGFDQTSCKTIESRWASTSDPFSNLLQRKPRKMMKSLEQEIKG
jgi:hypothetical protein